MKENDRKSKKIDQIRNRKKTYKMELDEKWEERSPHSR